MGLMMSPQKVNFVSGAMTPVITEISKNGGKVPSNGRIPRQLNQTIVLVYEKVS